ncbi:hypothetical protein [Salinispora vitiensis]|uniref:hypothetical protein n=1 Tax=Salinispora vitiensis TaxID=999544 RepID=UPI00037ECF39|nr:hypothetical protein [Salinispora vitiensis]
MSDPVRRGVLAAGRTAITLGQIRMDVAQSIELFDRFLHRLAHTCRREGQYHLADTVLGARDDLSAHLVDQFHAWSPQFPRTLATDGAVR